jgi:4-hydroxy-4-methyl-2-oxoglutarate aldolase
MIDSLPSIRVEPIQRPEASLVASLAGTPTGFIVDALGGSGALDYRIKPAIAAQWGFCGVAITCDCGPADNLALVHTLQYLAPGEVIVCATAEHHRCAVTGDLVLGMARNAGAIGFVTDGCVRDLPGLRAVGLPAYCMGVTPNSPHRSGPGTIGFPVTIAGHPINSGDVVVADQDGVVIVPQTSLQRVIDRLPAIRQAEAQADQSVRDGARLPGFLSPGS